LPLTPTGKIAKAELKKMVEDHLSGADQFATRP
jgi:hypothetical protein